MFMGISKSFAEHSKVLLREKKTPILILHLMEFSLKKDVNIVLQHY